MESLLEHCQYHFLQESAQANSLLDLFPCELVLGDWQYSNCSLIPGLVLPAFWENPCLLDDDEKHYDVSTQYLAIIVS